MFALLGLAAVAAAAPSPVAAVPTFECVSLEWSPPGATADAPCRVEYRPAGGAWLPGHDLWFDPVERQHRGSVVGLAPGTTYEFRLSLPDGHSATTTKATWPDPLPVSSVETLPAGTLSETVTITRGGDAAGFRLYRAHPAGTTIDVNDAHDTCVKIDADKVILQGVKCVGARVHGVTIAGRKDVVVEGCDISRWGRPDPTGDKRKRPDLGAQMDSGVYNLGADAERLVIQGNRVHHPRYTTNDWSEWSPFFRSNHPQGPKAVVFQPQTKGNHVIRFNEFTSDSDHLFNDVLLESNPKWPGNGLNRDSDIYGNVLSHAADDAIEIERGTRNVRVWENFFDGAGVKTISVRPSWEGPYYVFRNVVNRVYVPKGKSNYMGHDIPVGMFIVGAGRGAAGVSDEPRERGLGHVYHNTLACPPGAGFERFLVADFPQGLTSPELWFRSRNNVAATRPVRAVPNTPIHDFFVETMVSDYDLFTGPLDRPAVGGPHVVRGEPKFRPGTFRLADDSPGRAAGTPIPNFTPAHSGPAPDLGAEQTGAPPLTFGVGRWKPTPAGVRFERGKDKIEVRVGGETFATYVLRDPKIPRPYFKDVFAPGGVRVSRNQPPRPGEDATDHDTIHPGLWLAVGNLNGRDFWRNKARIEHEKFLEEPAGGPDRGRFAAANRWVGPDGKLVARETCRIDVFAKPNGTLLVWDSEFRPAAGDLVFGDEKVGVFGFRVATPLTGEKGGRIVNSRGDRGEAGAFGKDADWCDYSAAGRGGVVVLCDPGNPARSRFLVREYGVAAANPFGRKGLGGDGDGTVVVRAGGSLRLRFGAFVSAGEVDPAAVYADFVAGLPGR